MSSFVFWKHPEQIKASLLAAVRGCLLLNLLIAIICLPACRPQPAVWLDPVPTPTPGVISSSGGTVSLYFTAPGNDTYRGGPDQYLAEAIDQARLQVDGALYDLNLWSVRNALIRAHQRGVQVRLVVEGDSLERAEVQELIAAGIPLVADDSEYLMHNKFLVIDQAQVWTGSMNFTVNGAYRHLNNLVCVRSSLLAENYSAEFEEMFLWGFFGEDSLADTPHPMLEIDGMLIETYFSPDDSTQDRILELIQGAEESIELLMYSFTSDAVADALLSQASRGIEVRGVVDAYQERSGFGGEYTRLREGGVDLRLDGHPEKLHHKVIIIDSRIVVTGSYNLTRSAELFNDENTLILHDPGIAAAFQSEFAWIYQESSLR